MFWKNIIRPSNTVQETYRHIEDTLKLFQQLVAAEKVTNTIYVEFFR